MLRFIKYVIFTIVVAALAIGAYIYFTQDEEPDMTVPQIQLTESDTLTVEQDTAGAATMDLSEFSSVGDEEE